MSLDLDALGAAVAAHGRVIRVVVAETRGSVPREVGAAMLVWADGQAGTIGGGALEWDAVQAARAGRTGIMRHALGPSLGQCCGGAVTLASHAWDADEIARVPPDAVAVARGPGAMPPQVRAALGTPYPQLIGDWLVEPLSPAGAPLWIWGAGHVGRALVSVLSPLPGLTLSWVDVAPDRFPGEIPAGVAQLVAADPARLAARAPATARHLILTHSHDIDLALCHALLARPHRGIGLIGSATKWARFRTRLRALGHTDAQISGISCPIGRPELGKHPQAIAVGVAADLLAEAGAQQERRAG